MLRGFESQELGLVSEALFVAEECVTDFYRLSDSHWKSYRYELRTLEDLLPKEITQQALAQVVRLRQPPVAGGLRARDFYRICLQDHNMLELVQRREARKLLLPLLIYVLAHELVHVVRFYQFQHLFEAFESQRAVEEKTVHNLTSQLLRPLNLPDMDRVLSLYQEHGQGLVAFG